MSGIQADGIGVRDEVDLVAAVGEFESELRGDDPAAAVGGIASDADVHLAQRSKADLPMQILVGRCNVPATEPDLHHIAIHHHGGVADDFGVPGLASPYTAVRAWSNAPHRWNAPGADTGSP